MGDIGTPASNVLNGATGMERSMQEPEGILSTIPLRGYLLFATTAIIIENPATENGSVDEVNENVHAMLNVWNRAGDNLADGMLWERSLSCLDGCFRLQRLAHV